MLVGAARHAFKGWIEHRIAHPIRRPSPQGGDVDARAGVLRSAAADPLQDSAACPAAARTAAPYDVRDPRGVA